jgi:ethanolamine ammonia-lyase small subunit
VGLRQFTAARIALGRAGLSMPTAPQLAFQLAHAQARDAVHCALDLHALQQKLMQAFKLSADMCMLLQSAATDRQTYLKRPDLGRTLAAESRCTLESLQAKSQNISREYLYDVAFVIADGLSAQAIEINALPFLEIAIRQLTAQGLSLAPLTIVEQGRVAIADEIGELLSTKLVVILIGERPGLSSPDSMGLYVTWHPKAGLTDERRNCISNIRHAGLSYDEASRKLNFLITEAHRRHLTGIELKDETPAEATQLGDRVNNFLLADQSEINLAAHHPQP